MATAEPVLLLQPVDDDANLGPRPVEPFLSGGVDELAQGEPDPGAGWVIPVNLRMHRSPLRIIMQVREGFSHRGPHRDVARVVRYVTWKRTAMRFLTFVGGLAGGLILMITAALTALSTAILSPQDGDYTVAGIVFLMGLMFLVAGGLVIPLPGISMLLFAVASVFGFLMSNEGYRELQFHGGVAVVLTVMAYLGWRGVGEQM